MRRRGSLFALLACVALAYVALLGTRPLVAPDEFRYGEIPREMLATGDWVVPRLNGALYFEKPPLGYWFVASSMAVLGNNAFAVRLPFGLATLLTTAILFGLGRRSGGGAQVGILAAAFHLSSVEVFVVGSTAILDSLLTFWITACVAAFFLATETSPGLRRQGWLALSGVACGGAFLTKGLLAFAVAGVTLVPYLLWSRRPWEVVRMAVTPGLVALAVAAPWSLAIADAQPDFWRHFIMDEHVRRYAGGLAAQHSEPIWLYVPVLLVGLLPWTSLLGPAFRQRRALSADASMRFAICWAIGPFVLFSLGSGKLPTYVLPCLPPLALLLAGTCASLDRAKLARHIGWIAAGMGAITLAAGAVGLLLTMAPNAVLDPLYAPDSHWRVAVAGVALLATGSVCLASRSVASATSRIQLVATAVLLLASLSGVAFPDAIGFKTPGRWLSAHVRDTPADAILVTDRRLVHAVCWAFESDEVRLLGDPGELDYGLAEAGQAHKNLDRAGLEALLRDPRRVLPVVLIARTERLDLEGLPVPDLRDDHGHASFLRFDRPDRSSGVASRR